MDTGGRRFDLEERVRAARFGGLPDQDSMLRNMQNAHLRAMCEERLLLASGSRMDLIPRLLLALSFGFNASHWSHRSKQLLQEHLRARGLSLRGKKSELISRLESSPLPELELISNRQPLRAELRRQGLPGTGSVRELQERVRPGLMRRLEHENIVEASRRATRAAAAARTPPPPRPESRWVQAAAQARSELNITGFVAFGGSTPEGQALLARAREIYSGA